MRPRLRRIAAAGNTAAVALLVLVFAHGPALLGTKTEETQPAPSPAALDPPVLLVVIDALRDDRSRDPALMPRLNRLAREGGRTVARVESWIPSTVAGIRTVVEGEVPPPASFLEDFKAAPSRQGGIFAAAERGYAAGPRLWADLYGPWLAGSFSVPTLAADDERVVREGIAALRDGGHDLVVVHLSATDDVIHLHGGDSRQYLEALQRADARLGRLLDAAGPRAVIVTSDHGVTAGGGHAGPEPEVLAVPVVARGLELPPGELRQRDLHRLIAPRPPAAPTPQGPGRALPLLSMVAALAGALILSGRLARGREEWPAAVLLDATLWISLLAAVFAGPRLALALLLAALAVAVFRGEKRVDWSAVLPLLTAGWAFGAVRLLDGRLPAAEILPRGAVGLLTACAIAALAGWALRRLLSRPLALGWLYGVIPALLLRLLGETASLSTLDVRFAFRLVDGPLGLAGAVTAVVLFQALPALALLAGLAPALARAEPEVAGAFAAGLALSLAGQGAAAALALLAFPGEAVAGSLAVGLLVRLLGEVSYLFLGLAGLTTARERSRRPAATSR